MKKILTPIIIVSLYGYGSAQELSLERIQKEQPTESTTEILSQLSSDAFAGRDPGTEGFNLAVNYVESFLSKNRILPFFNNNYKDSVVVNGKASYNIVGLIGERNPDNKHILIGAHLDHLGISSEEERNEAERPDSLLTTSQIASDSIYNGANDNASGVTAVLQIAQQLRKYNFEQNIIIALFTGEEIDFIGSRHLAKKLKSDSVNLSYMLNFEMIGKTLSTGENQVFLTGSSKSNCAEEMNKIVDRTFVSFSQAYLDSGLFYYSDNYPFFEEFQVPCHTIVSFDFDNYDHYHKVSDEIIQLDVENMNSIIHSSTFIISQLLENKIELINH
jgi:Zn-dependent M28 family amino/carboxypeptidase